MISRSRWFFAFDRDFRKSLWRSAPYIFVLAAAAGGFLLAEWEKSTSHEDALSSYRHDASLESRRMAVVIEAKFHQIYQGIRTLARLPGVRSIDRYAKNFDENARSSAQEIYNNLAEAVAVSEVYIVPADFDPDAIDPNTGKLQEPITTFDELIVGRTADSLNSQQPDEIGRYNQMVHETEIYEYRLMKEQIAILKALFPDESRINRLSYPAIAGREVITCDNTRYSPSNPDDKDRMGLVYSVPFYNEHGALRGIVSAVILTAAVREMLPDKHFILGNAHYKYAVAREGNGRAEDFSSAETDLLYSETIALNITDLTGGWTLWSGLANENYWSSAGTIRASAKAVTYEIVIVVTAIVCCITLYATIERYRAGQIRRRELETAIAERTTNLAAATEAANAANQAKSRFLSVMSHEMRTPLSAIIGVADLLSRCRLEGDENRYVRLIQNSAESLLNIINDILDLSKIEAGRIELHPAPFAIGQIISDVVAMFAEQMQTKALRLVSKIDETVPAVISVDGVRLRQVLVNLVGNAVKFTEAGEIRVSAKAISWSQTWTRILFTVSDTGIGIEPQSKNSIFEPFRQGRNDATASPGGTGLGLSISRTLVEMMGGTIRYESDLGKGTTFYFDILVERATSPRAVPIVQDSAHQPETHGDPPRMEGARILLAEDNPVIQEVIREYLERLGVTVAIAEDGQKAVAMASSGKFDAILMDCQLPSMDGFKATRLIREQAEEAGRECAPIIALTANAFNEDRARCMKAGMSDYLSKPFTAAALQQMLSKHLHHTVCVA